jgi:hypothetical protein
LAESCGVISDCSNTGDIILKSNDGFGEVNGIGKIDSGELINCTNTGNITKEEYIVED